MNEKNMVENHSCMHEIQVSITGDIDTGLLEDINCMNNYFTVLEKYNVIGTFPVTAKAVVDFPDRINYIIKRGHTIEGHGDIHEGFYGTIEEQTKRLESMKKTIFDVTGIEINGFRAPWLQHDENLYYALHKAGLNFDSSEVHIPVRLFYPFFNGGCIINSKFSFLTSTINKLNNRRIKMKKIHHEPYFHNSGILEIPLLAYDDWFLIDSPSGPKYTPEESDIIGKIWSEQLLGFKYKTLVIQAHPGRMSPQYLSGLDFFLNVAIKSYIKFVTLAEISDSLKTNTMGLL